MSTMTVLGAVGGLHTLFLLALLVTRRHDEQTQPAAFARPPTHVRVLRDDPGATVAPEHMAFLIGN